MEAQSEEDERLRAVIEHVWTGLKAELVIELLQTLRPRWRPE